MVLANPTQHNTHVRDHIPFYLTGNLPVRLLLQKTNPPALHSHPLHTHKHTQIQHTYASTCLYQYLYISIYAHLNIFIPPPPPSPNHIHTNTLTHTPCAHPHPQEGQLTLYYLQALKRKTP